MAATRSPQEAFGRHLQALEAEDPTNWTVEELLPLVVKRRAIPLAVFMVRPVSADAVVCMN